MSKIFTQTISNGVRDLLGEIFKDDLHGMELEFRLRYYEEGKLVTGQSFIQFNRIIDRLQSARFQISEATTLDISHGSGRLTIEALDAIK